MASGSSSRLGNEAAGNAAVAAARMAKFDSQPYNTRRMYATYQREWEVRSYLLFTIVLYCIPLETADIFTVLVQSASVGGRIPGTRDQTCALAEGGCASPSSPAQKDEEEEGEGG